MGVEKTREQCKFCAILMNRLAKDLLSADESDYGGTLKGYTQLQEDIWRIRRELMRLQKQLDPWG